MKKNYITAAALIAILIAVFVVFNGAGTCDGKKCVDTAYIESTSVLSPIVVQRPLTEPGSRQATDPRSIRIIVGDATYLGLVQNGSTVLEAMKQLRTEGLTFEGRDYPSLGFFIESINGKKNAGGNYWFLYVNGVSSNTGAAATRLQDGDTVEWRYGKRN